MPDGMVFDVYHMRNETDYPENDEVVSSYHGVTLGTLKESIKHIWSSRGWKDRTDWIRVYPKKED